jgi:hypothetical protein
MQSWSWKMKAMRQAIRPTRDMRRDNCREVREVTVEAILIRVFWPRNMHSTLCLHLKLTITNVKQSRIGSKSVQFEFQLI